MHKMKKAILFLLAAAMMLSLPLQASAANVDDATIDLSRSGSVDIYKYDLTSAEKDGIWDSSSVSTGVRDEEGVETILGSSERVSSLNANGEAYGYAIKGVEFRYIKVAEIHTFTETTDNGSRIEVLYGISPNEENNRFLAALGLSAEDRYTAADDETGLLYFQGDTLIDSLRSALDANATSVKNVLESYVKANGGTAMAETDAYGHTSASELPLGLYLFVETRVPEMVTETTSPFLVSVPMTSVNGSNTQDGGERWIYDITLYPKNLTGIPSLEKTVREAMDSTGVNNGTATITDGYAHTATASDGDTLEYQIISTLPSITSAASYLSDYSFTDTLSQGLSYNKDDVLISFFRDADCTDKITAWDESSGKFSVSYSVTDAGESVMSIAMTDEGLNEINTSTAVYTDAGMVNSGYSDCTMRITYACTLHTDSSVVYGDTGNSNDVVLVWKRSNTEYYDTLVDDCHVFVYGIDLTKKFSDGKGDLSKVEMTVQNDTDGYFVLAELNEDEGVYYVCGRTDAEDEATHFVPTDNGSILIKGLEDDKYILTEVKTDNAYNLLKNQIEAVITRAETEELCDIYASDVLGLIQNDPRYADVEEGLFVNMPQKHLEHKLLTVSAKVNGKEADMAEDKGSANALLPFTVINTRGFDLPQTGSYGNWMFPVIGFALLAASAAMLYFSVKEKKKDNKE